MAYKIKNILNALRTTSKTSAGQTAGKAAALVGGATVAAYAIPTATGAGLSNMGSGGAKSYSGIIMIGILAVIAIIALPKIRQAIK
ncbi:MAG: hypothetical protein PHQ97_15190 [Desulfobacterales bacterium]|nr:hypothetical protein [Desulfobacterales bacterium]